MKPHHGDEAHDHEHGKVHHQENTEEEEIGNQAEPAASPEAKGEPERAVQNLEKRNESEGKRPSDVDKVFSLLFFILFSFLWGRWYM